MERSVLFILLIVGFLPEYAISNITKPLNPKRKILAFLESGSYEWDNYRLQDPYTLHYICNNKSLMEDDGIEAIMYGCPGYIIFLKSTSDVICPPGKYKPIPCPENVKVPIECGQNKSGDYDTIITCQGDKPMHLECGPSQVLNIIDAEWGRFDQTTCASFPDLYKNCTTVDDTFVRVRERCHGKRFCLMNPTIPEFSNPCEFFGKYLIVKYKCQNVDHRSIATVNLCGYQSQIIQCPSGSSIRITDGFYGSIENAYCKPSNNSILNCSAEYVQDKLGARCDYKKECTLSPTNDWFRNPCENENMYMKVSFRCLIDKFERIINCEKETLTLKCAIGTKIHIVEAYYGRSHPFICNTGNEPQTDIGCRSINETTFTRNRCEGQAECSFIPNIITSHCAKFDNYIIVDYLCKDKNEPPKPVVLPDAKVEFDISPGPVIVSTITSNSIAFRIPEMKYSTLYKVQIRDMNGHTWFHVINEHRTEDALDRDQTIKNLKPNRSYDIRVILRNCKCCRNSCVPFTRFTTQTEGSH